MLEYFWFTGSKSDPCNALLNTLFFPHSVLTKLYVAGLQGLNRVEGLWRCIHI